MAGVLGIPERLSRQSADRRGRDRPCV